MDKNSSIFNFKSAVTPAFGWAVLLVFLVEFLVLPNLPSFIPFQFEQNNYELPGRQDYDALRTVFTFGPQIHADIAVLGSSRSREGILNPLLKRDLEGYFKREFQVANYTLAASRVFELELLAQRLTEPSFPPPRLVVLPINARFLQSDAHRNQRRFYLMSWSHLLTDVFRFGLDAPLHIVEAVTSNITENLFALRYAAKEWREGSADHDFKPFQENPIFGGYARNQLRERELEQTGGSIQSIASAPIAQKDLTKYIQSEWPPGITHLGALEKEAFIKAIKQFTHHGVAVLLMDLPMSSTLEKAIPQQGFETYRAFLRSTAQELQIDFVAHDAFPPFTDHDFREQSHLNLHGARKLTQFISNRIATHHENILRDIP